MPFSDFWFWSMDQSTVTFSPQLNYVYGKMHGLELGLGAFCDYFNSEYLLIPRIGYRYEQPSKAFMFKVAFTPVIGKDGIEVTWLDGFVPHFGVAVGYSF